MILSIDHLYHIHKIEEVIVAIDNMTRNKTYNIHTYHISLYFVKNKNQMQEIQSVDDIIIVGDLDMILLASQTTKIVQLLGIPKN